MANERRTTTRRRTSVDDAGEDGYQALEAEAGDDADIRDEADELSIVDAEEPLDEDVEDADPVSLRIDAAAGDEIERDIAETPAAEREPPSNYDEPRVFPPRDAEPTTGDHNLEDLDAEGDWPDE